MYVCGVQSAPAPPPIFWGGLSTTNKMTWRNMTMTYTEWNIWELRWMVSHFKWDSMTAASFYQAKHSFWSRGHHLNANQLWLPSQTLKSTSSQLVGPLGLHPCEAANQKHCMNSLREKLSQKPQINNAVFYLNSYLCEAKSSPEILVLFISIREEEETNHLVQCVSLFVQMCLNIQYSNASAALWVCVCVSPITSTALNMCISVSP